MNPGPPQSSVINTDSVVYSLISHGFEAELRSSRPPGSRQLFSLLSVTSYSSLALHKLTLLVYNISSIRSLENNLFRRRFCYCVTNETNDLTDFTAILLDVIGNSTSYLHELFKSTSILSVSQRNNSDCIYICVMAGSEVPELWEVDSITPLFNQTIVEGPHRGNVSSFRLPDEWHQLPTNVSHVSPPGLSSMLTSRVHSTAHVSSTVVDETTATQPTATTAPVTSHRTTSDNNDSSTADRTVSAADHLPTGHSSCQCGPAHHRLVQNHVCLTRDQCDPGHHSLTTAENNDPTHDSQRSSNSRNDGGEQDYKTSELENYNTQQVCGNRETRRPELIGGESIYSGTTTTTTVSAHKLQPCVLELCKFFSQCLCRPFNHKTRMKRYCADSHLWYEKHTSEVCRRVRRVSFSRNLKQRCLTKMCNKL
ncbi:hypothetical protein INR49_022601 [Caranx melampygus]|nr:hypothetical protein INR49_022601 [Caranx melampygus]